MFNKSRGIFLLSVLLPLIMIYLLLLDFYDSVEVVLQLLAIRIERDFTC